MATFDAYDIPIMPMVGAFAHIPAKEVSPSLFAPPPVPVEYTMRGYNTVLMKQVFWISNEVDADASDYTTPGDISLPSIVVFRVKGA